MSHRYVRSCGVAAMLLAQPAFAQTKIVLNDADSGRVFEGIGAVSSGGSSRNFLDCPGKQKSVSLEGNSIYTLSTTTGQKKGAHPPPPPVAAFPLPYKDDFESYAAGVIPNKLKVPPLATGKIDGFIPATWHHLTLVLKGDELTASIDTNELARVRYQKFYPAHKSGRAYLMSSYDPNCFDNLSVTP